MSTDKADTQSMAIESNGAPGGDAGETDVEREASQRRRSRRWYRSWLFIALSLFAASVVAPFLAPALQGRVRPGGMVVLIFGAMWFAPMGALAAAISAVAGKRGRFILAWAALLSFPIGLVLIYVEVQLLARPLLGLLWMPVSVVGTTILGYLIDSGYRLSEEERAEALSEEPPQRDDAS